MINPKALRKSGTQTSTFGSSGRENHDSSKFYDSKLYKNIKVKIDDKIQFVENPVPPENIDRIFHKSAESMSELPDGSVHLMVTSPPYNVSKDYDDDLSLDEYRRMLRNVFRETYRVLVTGGRACVNIANVGRKPYVPLHSYIIEDMLDIGFMMRGEIIWNKSASAGGSTAWGSWMSPSNPCLRDVHEYILIFCKESFNRRLPKGIKAGSSIRQSGDPVILTEVEGSTADPVILSEVEGSLPLCHPGSDILRNVDNNVDNMEASDQKESGIIGRNTRYKTIQRDEFLQWTKSVWEFPTVSARKIGHPAPFPEELPHRLIQLYTYSGEIVLDPFCGSGTTCVAACRDGRHYVGYDINDEYVRLAEKRTQDVLKNFLPGLSPLFP